jgi:hypothetical protein
MASLEDRLKDYLKENLQELGGQAKAAYREGAKDLWNAVVPAFPANVHGVDEPGTPLSPTQLMVNQDLGAGFDKMLDGYGSRGGQDQGRDQERGLER